MKIKLFNIILVFFLWNILPNLNADESGQSLKKFVSKLKEYEHLTLDFKDAVDMGEIKTAKNLCFKLSRYTGVSTELNKIVGQIEKSQGDIQKINTELAECKTKNSQLQAKNQEYESQIQEMQSRFSQTQLDLSTCQSQMASSQGSESNLRFEIQDLRSRLDRMQDDYTNCQTNLSNAQMDLKDCQNKSFSTSTSSSEKSLS